MMPRYRYECEECKKIFTAFHSFKDTLDNCKYCETTGSLNKLLNTPYINKKVDNEAHKVGELTKKFIEENREILKNQKKELNNKDYDET